jgi:sugar lactone lactonase YvrE
VHTLYAVNHAGRESIEVFRLDARSASPTAIWTGCILMPKGAAANAVAALPRGRIAVTKFQSARSPDAILDVLKGAISGSVYIWTPGAGFKELPGAQLSGNNGLVASPDGRWLFVNAYGGKAVYRFPLAGGAPRKVAVDIRPDNIRWGVGGKLLVTGQFITPETLNQPHGWAVLRLDPQSMAISVVMKEPPRPQFDDATTAIPAGGQLWIGTFRGDRIAYTPLK